MRKNTENTTTTPGFPALIEPLAFLARFSWDWAPLLCNPEHDCCAYHRSWSLVRLIQKAGALPAGLSFFQEQIAGLVAQDRKRVLISGAADTGLLALVCNIFRSLEADPQIVLIDRCRTTVTQNRILASYLGLDADIKQGDIREIDCEPVDAVIAHSFLVFFPQPARQEVINAWGRVLKPGGKVLMSATIAAGEAVPTPPKDEAKILAARPHLEGRARELGLSTTEASELGELAVSLWRKQLAHPPNLTRANLADAFSLAGISLEAVTLKEKERQGPLASFRLASELLQRGEIVGTRL
jgi:SAM-dependent methyltransferase